MTLTEIAKMMKEIEPNIKYVVAEPRCVLCGYENKPAFSKSGKMWRDPQKLPGEGMTAWLKAVIDCPLITVSVKKSGLIDLSPYADSEGNVDWSRCLVEV